MPILVETNTPVQLIEWNPESPLTFPCVLHTAMVDTNTLQCYPPPLAKSITHNQNSTLFHFNHLQGALLTTPLQELHSVHTYLRQLQHKKLRVDLNKSVFICKTPAATPSKQVKQMKPEKDHPLQEKEKHIKETQHAAHRVQSVKRPHLIIPYMVVLKNINCR